jgi:hypothetical protein
MKGKEKREKRCMQMQARVDGCESKGNNIQRVDKAEEGNNQAAPELLRLWLYRLLQALSFWFQKESVTSPFREASY